MENFADHTTVKHFYEERTKRGEVAADRVLDAAWLRQLCLDAGADDVGFVERDRPEIADQKADIENVFPRTRTLISVVCRMNRENIRTPARSISNLEFHHTTDETNEVARRIVSALEEVGIGAINGGAVGFPMEADRWGSKMWVISHKPIAVAAGLGQMGIHRNVIHPEFGNFILLGTVLVDAEISEYSHPVVYNPCLECKLCVAACPTGAIGPDGQFNFSACYTHNYREFMGGFSDWVEKIADSKNAHDYRKNVSGAETVSMWQSLSFGANYKAANCMAVCPAGEDVIAPFLTNRKQFLDDVVRPLQNKPETRVIGTVCQYPDGDSARKSVAGLLMEINTNGVNRFALPMTIAEVCDHFVQRELTNDYLWRSLFHKEILQGVFKTMDCPTLGQRASFRSENNGSGVMAAWAATREEQLCKNPKYTLGSF